MMTNSPNPNAVSKQVLNLLETLQIDTSDPSLSQTPRRVAKMYVNELLSGYHQDPAKLFTTFEANGYNDLVIVRDIPFYSLCEHHMIPFFGHVHIGYVPNGRVVGLSKLVRLVEVFARRLQIQERLTAQITDNLMHYLQPQGAITVVVAEHLCMAMRGVQKPGTKTITSAVRGEFDSDLGLRNEFLNLIKGVSS